MAKKDKGKSIIKDITILLSIWGPLLFIIIGGIIWINDGLDGTIMERLFPAMFWGFICAFFVIIILSKLLKYSPIFWWLGGMITFIAMVVLYMLEITSIFIIALVVIFCAIIIIALIKWTVGLMRTL